MFSINHLIIGVPNFDLYHISYIHITNHCNVMWTVKLSHLAPSSWLWDWRMRASCPTGFQLSRLQIDRHIYISYIYIYYTCITDYISTSYIYICTYLNGLYFNYEKEWLYRNDCIGPTSTISIRLNSLIQN